MRNEWDARFAAWAQAPDAREHACMVHALNAVRAALAAAPALAAVTRVFVHGAYRNRVNVRAAGAVDLGVLWLNEHVFGVDDPVGSGPAAIDHGTTAAHYAAYKDVLDQALSRHFGTAFVRRGQHAFAVRNTITGVSAEVVPLFVHRRYLAHGGYLCGTELHADRGGRITHWPERLYDTAHWPNQHYENGSAKNNATREAYRGVVRILKTLREALAADGLVEARAVRGFDLECLVWNTPGRCFSTGPWRAYVSAVLSHLAQHLAAPALCADWREVSNQKTLLGGDEGRRLRLHGLVTRLQQHLAS